MGCSFLHREGQYKCRGTIRLYCTYSDLWKEMTNNAVIFLLLFLGPSFSLCTWNFPYWNLALSKGQDYSGHNKISCLDDSDNNFDYIWVNIVLLFPWGKETTGFTWKKRLCGWKDTHWYNKRCTVWRFFGPYSVDSSLKTLHGSVAIGSFGKFFRSDDHEQVFYNFLPDSGDIKGIGDSIWRGSKWFGCMIQG